MSTVATVTPSDSARTTPRSAPVAEWSRTPLWLWPNLLCLDAPVVALVWQDFLARCYGIPLRPTGRWTLGLAVWAIYLADRLLDVRFAAQGVERTPHRFCRQHPELARGLMVLALGADVVLSLFWLRRPVFWNGAAVVAAVAAYFAVFPLRRMATAWKPAAAAALFTVGVFLVAFTQSELQSGLTPMQVAQALGLPAAAFAALCLVNLFLLQDWERAAARKREARPNVRIAVGAAVLALGCVGRAHGNGDGASQWHWAAALAAAGLVALALGGDRLGKDARRVLADAVLLSPLLMIWTRTG